MLDRPIAFHRSFVRLTGSVAAAVMLSQAVYWQKRDKHHDGWWWKPEAEWEDETGLNRREQQTARKHLIKLGCWREDRKGVPAKLWFNLDLDALNNLLHQTVQLAAQNGATGGTDPCNYARASSVVSYLETTSETTPETTHPPEPSPSAPVVSGFEAFWKSVNGILLRAVEAQSAPGCQLDLAARGSRYVPHPATWLNQRRWEDEPEVQTQPPPPESFEERASRKLKAWVPPELRGK